MELKIDKAFKNLIPPLSTDEYKQLEENLLNDGCRDPIYIWNGTIIDGHKRYEICLRHNIPFKTQPIYLETKNEVIGWICANQIERQNITVETRRYLIGKRYESEKYIGIRNNKGKNLHFLDNEVGSKMWGDLHAETTRSMAARRLGEEYRLSHSTIEKYGAYTRAIDNLADSDKELVPKILSGQTKISYENVIELAKLPEQELKRISKQLVRNERIFVGYTATQRDIENRRSTLKMKPLTTSELSIKDMPEFDPDAGISSLSLTIPSWISSINRTQSTADLTLVSNKAKTNLIKALDNLKEAADGLLSEVKE